jgi:Domain of unknown function (DUF4261)
MGSIAFHRLTREFTDQSMPLLVVILDSKPGAPPADRYDLSQTWGWEQSREALHGTSHTVLIVDIAGRLHEPAARLRAFLAVVRAVAAQCEPIGVWWPASQVATPAARLHEQPGGTVNVRMYRDAADTRFTVMDTLGLHTLGLPDAQVYFRDFETGRVAGLLMGLAAYLVDGATIQPGATVQGWSPDQKWRTAYAAAKVDPDRLVLDLDPAQTQRS